MNDNIILLTDTYKPSHHKMFPKGIQKAYCYLESRGGVFPSTRFFGLQYLLKQYLEGVVVDREKIDRAERRFKQTFGRSDVFNRSGWEYILNKHGGKLPISVRAVPEGAVIPTKNILLSVENTDDECWWLPNYLEPLFIEMWYPITVCTQSFHAQQIIKRYMMETCDNLDGLPFKLHDFGLRGVSSLESAAIGGAAHLVNFSGTDTLPALDLIEKYYYDDNAGYSIPATEHSTITSWLKENEVNAYDNLLNVYPEGLVACVSDSYNIYDACRYLWGTTLKDKVMNRNGVLVVRPDSGVPEEVVWDCIQILDEKFGHTVNSKGYKVLDPHVRMIQGDGVDLDTISSILGKLTVHKWSVDNIAFGSGGALLQKLNRDTQKFAYKMSACKVNGEWRKVYKEPVTDSGKVSKKGRLKLIRTYEGPLYNYRTTPQDENLVRDELVEVFRDGEILIEQDFRTIKDRS